MDKYNILFQTNNIYLSISAFNRLDHSSQLVTNNTQGNDIKL